MGYVLLWLFLSAGCVCWLAAALATPARVSNLFSRIVLRVVLILPILGGIVFLFFAVDAFQKAGFFRVGDPWLVCSVMSLPAVALMGMLFQRWWRRPGDSQRVEAGAVRRRTVGALYGLALLLTGLHVFTAYVLAGATAGTVDALMVKPQAVVQEYLDQDRTNWTPKLAVRDPALPQDAQSALEICASPTAPLTPGQAAARAWYSTWVDLILARGKPAATCRSKLIDYATLGTAEDDIEATLTETVRRFGPEMEELRAALKIRPWSTDFDIAQYTLMSSQHHMYLQGLGQNLRVDALGAQMLQDWPRARADIAALEDVADLCFARDNAIGAMVAIANRAFRQAATERFLSAPGLTAEAVTPLPIGGGWTAQQRLARVVRFDTYMLLRMDVEAARNQPRAYQAMLPHGMPPTSGYIGWLVKAYFIPNEAEGVAQLDRELTPLLDAPCHLHRETWRTWSDYKTDCKAQFGISGDMHCEMWSRIYLQAVTVDVYDDLLRIAKAATLYRFEHGRYPDRSEQLVPTYLSALPVDRFNGQPLHLRVEDDGQGLVLWSVGEDGEDGGAPVTADARNGEYDPAVYLGTCFQRIDALLQAERQKLWADE